jgi:hypothetical protein
MREPTDIVSGVLSSDDPYVRLWLRTLENAAEPGRLARGRLYYAAGNVVQLRVESGFLRGLVSGTTEAPYQVSTWVNEYSDSDWKAAQEAASKAAQEAASKAAQEAASKAAQGVASKAAQGVASKAAGSAVMSGQHSSETQPTDETQATEHILTRLDRIWRSLGISTFSERIEFGVRAVCSCPDREEMCKHVAAMWYEFGERLHTDPSLFITLFGGFADSWTHAPGGSGQLSPLRQFSQSGQRASDREAGDGPPMVLLPADAERNLQDRSLAESLSRYWRPIREIRQPDDDGAATPGADLPVELELHVEDLREILCEDSAAFRRSLERMYAEIRRRAAEIRLDIGLDTRLDIGVNTEGPPKREIEV